MARAVGSKNGGVLSLAWNIADRTLLEERFASIEGRLGQVEILVNITGGPPPSLASETPTGVWIDHFDKMVVSVMAITARALPGMRRRGWGRIVTSTSSGVVTPIPKSRSIQLVALGSGRLVEDAGAGSRSRRGDRQFGHPRAHWYGTRPCARQGQGGARAKDGRGRRVPKRGGHSDRSLWSA